MAYTYSNNYLQQFLQQFQQSSSNFDASKVYKKIGYINNASD